MARKRSDRLHRLVAVQRRVEQLAEIDLAETNRERERIRRSMEETVGAMGSLDGVHPVFSGVYARRVASLAMKADRLSGLAGVQQRRLRTEQAKGDRLAAGEKEARAEEERALEDEELYDLVDRTAGQSSAPASRKLRDP